MSVAGWSKIVAQGDLPLIRRPVTGIVECTQGTALVCKSCRVVSLHCIRV